MKYHFLFLLLSSFYAQSQDLQVGKIYSVETSCYVKEVADNTCTGTKTIALCENTKFLVKSKTADNASYFIKPITRWYYCADSTHPAAKEDNLWCLAVSDVPNHITAIPEPIKVKFDFGILAVPFKFDGSSFKVYPGGNISLYFGPSIIFPKNKDFYLLPAAFFGFSPIPLNAFNSTSSSDIKTTEGFTYGGGLIINVKSGFQIGGVIATDLFNADNTATKRTWLSASVGYQFLRHEEKSPQ